MKNKVQGIVLAAGLIGLAYYFYKKRKQAQPTTRREALTLLKAADQKSGQNKYAGQSIEKMMKTSQVLTVEEINSLTNKILTT